MTTGKVSTHIPIDDAVLYTPSFITMSFVNLCTVSSFGSFFLFPIFLTQHGGTKSDIGIIMGIFTLSAVLFRPWISHIIDSFGRKRCYTIGSIIMSVHPLIYLFFHGDLSHFYFPLILVRISHGIGLAICFTAAFTYIADIIPKERLNEGIGMFGVTGIAGLAAGPAIGELVITRYGFPVFFMASAGIATLGLLTLFPLPESYVNANKESSQSFFSLLAKRKIFIVFMLSIIFGFGLSASGSFVAPFAQYRDISFISLYYICYSSAAIITRLIGGKIADNIGEERVVPYALLLSGGGLLILIFLGGNVILTLSGILSGCGHGFLFPSLDSMAIRNEPIDVRGKITGIFTGALDGGALMGSMTLGYIGEWTNFQGLFLVAGLLLLAGLLIIRYKNNVSAHNPDEY